jgi:8-oxo-dGTP pyrophosphatase MutT (NUDIX family)
MGSGGLDRSEAIRPAATVVLWRDGPDGPRVLMGQRGAGAAFMPSKFVFPGGAVDPEDAGVQLATALDPLSQARLAQASDGPAPATLAAAAIRELWEETGLALAVPGTWIAPADAGEDWARMAASGLAPAAHAMRFIFRAITPPGRTRRFDARFFLVPYTALAGDADDLSAASGELAHLQWIAPGQARALDLPFITEIVLAEVAQLLGGGGDQGVPFFDNAGERPAFRRLV